VTTGEPNFAAKSSLLRVTSSSQEHIAALLEQEIRHFPISASATPKQLTAQRSWAASQGAHFAAWAWAAENARIDRTATTKEMRRGPFISTPPFGRMSIVILIFINVNTLHGIE
jgi:hypothetical protein